jgi:hypothetical protein
MEIGSVVWMVLPLLIFVVYTALRKKIAVALASRVKISGMTYKIVGLVVAATIICVYIAWRLMNGGF